MSLTTGVRLVLPWVCVIVPFNVHVADKAGICVTLAGYPLLPDILAVFVDE